MFLSFQGFPSERAQIQLQSVSSGDGRLHTPIAHARAADQPHALPSLLHYPVALFTLTTRSSARSHGAKPFFVSRSSFIHIYRVRLHVSLFLGNSIHHQECTSGPACTASVSPIITREPPSSPARPSFHPISARRVLFMHRDCAALARPLSVLAARLCLVSGAFQIQPTPVSSVSPKDPSDPPQTGIY